MTTASPRARTGRARRSLPGIGSARGRTAWTAAGTFVAGSALLALGLTGQGQLPGLALVQDAPPSWFVPSLLVGCLAMLGKRAAPVTALLVGVAAFAVDIILGGSIAGFLYIIDLLYNAALIGSPQVRRALWIAACIVIAGPTVAVLVATAELRWGVLMGLQQAVLYLGPLWWARDVRTTTELAAVAAARADAVERLAESERWNAVRAERDALARDLHDAVASHLSAIALHSGGALATAADPAKDRRALELTRRSALESMQEMHSLIALLREPEPFGDPDGATRLPGLADIPELVDQARSTGRQVELIGLERAGDYPAPTGLAGYRIVQESLANAAKHAPGEGVEVRIEPSDSRIALSISNNRTADGQGSSTTCVTGAGLGLINMRERAAALGGTVRIDARPGTWTVTADLPRTSGDPA